MRDDEWYELMRAAGDNLMSVAAERERELRETVATIVREAHALCRREFAAQLEEYARNHDLLPRH